MMIFPLISKTVLKKIGTLVCSNSVFSRTERPWNSLLAGFFYSTYFLNGLKFRVVGKFYRCAFFFSLFSYYCNFMPHSSFPVQCAVNHNKKYLKRFGEEVSLKKLTDIFLGKLGKVDKYLSRLYKNCELDKIYTASDEISNSS